MYRRKWICLAIFIIIDEFAQMSQILRMTKGDGYKADYTLKLENLLREGAAFGFKFIFASQTYSDGVEGLTEPARKQIQHVLPSIIRRRRSRRRWDCLPPG